MDRVFGDGSQDMMNDEWIEWYVIRKLRSHEILLMSHEWWRMLNVLEVNTLEPYVTNDELWMMSLFMIHEW